MVAPKLVFATVVTKRGNRLLAKALVSSFHSESGHFVVGTNRKSTATAAVSNSIRLHRPTKPSLIRFKSTLYPPSDIQEKSSTNKPQDETTTAATWSDTINLGIQVDKQEHEASSAVLKESIQGVVSSSQEKEEEETAAVATTSSNKKPWMWDLGIPSLTQEWKNMFSASTLFTEVSAGLTVGCVAVPLSLAIAVASGVPAEVGLVTAAVSGVAGGLLGGTTLAITGPAAAISLLVVSAVEQHGLEALPLITLGCGAMQLGSGIIRGGQAAKLVPVSVIAGFTTGVGMMILSGQVPKALGLSAPSGLNPLETMAFIGEHVSSVNPAAAALAVGTAGAMYALPKLHSKIPAALLAVGGATAATHSMGLDVSLVGQIPSGLGAFQLAVPAMPAVDALPSLAATTLLIYAMTSAESLLSCAALEKMKKTSYKHNPDQELIGQGLANMGSAAFMGMPVTSVIARSSLNVRLNASTRLPALIQAGFVFSSVVFFSDSIATIPMPALSGMLIISGMGMLNPTEFKHCHKVQKMDTIPFLSTITGMMAFGLAEGIGIGCVSAFLLNYDHGRLKVQESQVAHRVEDDGLLHVQEMQLPTSGALQYDVNDPSHTIMTTKSSTAFNFNGPINFGSMFEIDELIHAIHDKRAEVDAEHPIVLNMQGVTSVEFTGVEELVNRLIEVADTKGSAIPIQMWNCSDELQNALALCDPNRQISVNCEVTTAESSPYHFPEPEPEAERVRVSSMMETPNFRP